MKAPVNSRYAHCEGITDIEIYNDALKDPTSKGLVTCGGDGDVRLWNSPSDEDPVVFSASDTCLAVSCHKDTLYVATEGNAVESYALPSGKNLGNVAKFTAAVNHLQVSFSGKILVAGSGDMTFQILKLGETTGPPVKVEGHTAPVLSVLIDPQEELIISVGCDGCACVWNLNGKQLHNWDGLFQSSNDILTSCTLCRPSWHPSGAFLAIPQKDKVVIYSRGSWQETRILKSRNMVSVTKFSACGNFLAGGCIEGTILVWDFNSTKLIYENVDNDYPDHITGLIFSSDGKDIFAVNIKGRMISVENFQTEPAQQHQNLKQKTKEKEKEKDFDFDSELEEDIVSNKKVMKGAVSKDEESDVDNAFGDDDDMDLLLARNVEDDDDDDQNEISISNIKAMAGFIASDKEDVFVGVDKAKKQMGIKIKDEDDDDALSVSSFNSDSARPSHQNQRPIPLPTSFLMPFTEPQKPFQPSSTPEHLEHRFMIWNEIGIIRNYTVEDDDSDAIDIEFHDISFHTAIHMRNQNDFVIATLGKEAAVFASPKQKDQGSKLMCLHFSSWDKNKEWTTDLPKGEEITGLASGIGWLAVSTNIQRLRIFTVGGVQKYLFEIGGTIIAISGHDDLLFLTYQNGLGLHGNQSLAYSLFRIRSGSGVFPLISCEALPLSPKSELSWMGFTDEGTPTFSDTKESLRVLNGRMWTTYLDMKESLSGESDHFWVTGVSICSQHVRAIKCKGVKYPAALPKPTIILLDAKLPLCEMETEKSELEDGLLRSIMLKSLTKKMDKKGFDVEDYKEKAEKLIKENLMKLFAMSCKGDKDYRASEYVTLMPTTHSIQLAMKYASKVRKMALGDRIAAIGRKKQDEEGVGVEDEDDDFENMRVGNVIYSSVYSNLGNVSGGGASYSGSQDLFASSFSSMNGERGNNPATELIILEENPLLSKQRAEIRNILSTSVYKNPFKKDSVGPSSKNSNGVGDASKGDSSSTIEEGKGIAMIDSWKKPIEKSLEFNPKNPNSKGASKKAQAAAEKAEKKEKIKKNDGNNKSDGKKQATLFQMSKKLTKESPISPASFEEGSEDSVMSISMDEEASSSSVVVEKKRKRNLEDNEEKGDETEKKSRISSKLAAFSRCTNDDD